MPHVESERIEVLRKEGTPEAARRIQELEAETRDKEIRKAARRALYLLSQRGVTPPASDLPVLPKTSAVEQEELRAIVSAYDGAGNRQIYLIVPDPDGGSPTMILFILNDMTGIQDFQLQRVSHRELPEWIARIYAQLDAGIATAEFEGDYGRWLLKRGRMLNHRQARPSPSGLLAWLPRIKEPEQDYVTSPIYTHLSVESIAADTLIPHDPDELFQLPWFDAWYFAAEDTVPWLSAWKLAEAKSEGGEDETPELTPELEEVLSDAVRGLLPPEMRARYITRLEESAEVLRRRGKENEAKQTLYQAIDLSTDRDITEVPFARAIVRRTIGAAFEMLRIAQEQQQAAGSRRLNVRKCVERA